MSDSSKGEFVQCKKCGANFKPGRKTCLVCGSRLEEKKNRSEKAKRLHVRHKGEETTTHIARLQCPECHQWIDVGRAICQTCGFKLPASEVAAAEHGAPAEGEPEPRPATVPVDGTKHKRFEVSFLTKTGGKGSYVRLFPPGQLIIAEERVSVSGTEVALTGCAVMALTVSMILAALALALFLPTGWAEGPRHALATIPAWGWALIGAAFIGLCVVVGINFRTIPRLFDAMGLGAVGQFLGVSFLEMGPRTVHVTREDNGVFSDKERWISLEVRPGEWVSFSAEPKFAYYTLKDELQEFLGPRLEPM